MLTWASATSPACGCRRNTGRRPSGSAKPPTRATRRRSSTWPLYVTGQGVPQNYADAVKWYHAAAEQGEPQAQFNLGVFYETGQVVPQNLRGGREVVSRSPPSRNAPRRNATSAFATKPGRGVPKNVREAVKWFCRAARAGDKTAQHNLGVYYASLGSRRSSHRPEAQAPADAERRDGLTGEEPVQASAAADGRRQACWFHLGVFARRQKESEPGFPLFPAFNFENGPKYATVALHS